MSGLIDEQLGRALAGHRDEFVLATKFGIVSPPFGGREAKIDGRPEYVRPPTHEAGRQF